MKSSLLPAKILKCINESDRKSLGKDGLLPHEISQKLERQSEAQLQKLIYSELLRRGLFFHYSRSDRRTTTRLGTPDFALPLAGSYVAIECKTPIGKLTSEQTDVGLKIKGQGGDHWVVRSFDEFLDVLKSYGL